MSSSVRWGAVVMARAAADQFLSEIGGLPGIGGLPALRFGPYTELEDGRVGWISWWLGRNFGEWDELQEDRITSVCCLTPFSGQWVDWVPGAEPGWWRPVVVGEAE